LQGAQGESGSSRDQGYLEATMTFGLRHPEYEPILREKLTLKNDEV